MNPTLHWVTPTPANPRPNFEDLSRESTLLSAKRRVGFCRVHGVDPDAPATRGSVSSAWGNVNCVRGVVLAVRRLAVEAFVGVLVVLTGGVFGAVVGGLMWLWTFALFVIVALGLNGRAGTSIDPEALTASWLMWCVGVFAILGVLVAVGRGVKAGGAASD